MLVERVGNHPERINNLLFLYSLLLKSFYKSENIIKQYNYFTGNEEDELIPEYLHDLYNRSVIDGKSLCEDCLRKELMSTGDGEDFENFFDFDHGRLDQLKMRFRNISQIIDCVSCQKCKLHGKLQIYGLATMFKILFSKKSQDISFKRNELISFVNLIGKVSKSIKYLYDHIKSEKLNSSSRGSSGLIYTVFFTFSIWLVVVINIYFYKTAGGRRKNNPKEKEIINIKNKEKSN